MRGRSVIVRFAATVAGLLVSLGALAGSLHGDLPWT